MGRDGLRMAEFIRPACFRKHLEENLAFKNEVLTKVLGEKPIDVEAVLDEYSAYAERIRPAVVNCGVMLDEQRKAGKKILFEGAQGTLLDVDHGTYPYVTSSSTVSGGAAIGAGVGPVFLDKVIGISKAYTTRVGEGPFPTELFDDVGKGIAERGAEFGATTGRPRRCGWLDALVLKHAVRVNSLTGLAVTKLDVLSGMNEVRIATAYDTPEGRVHEVPAARDVLAAAKPVYETMEGWGDARDARHFSELPAAARRFVDRIEELTGIPVVLLSVGPGREETIVRENPFG